MSMWIIMGSLGPDGQTISISIRELREGKGINTEDEYMYIVDVVGNH